MENVRSLELTADGILLIYCFMKPTDDLKKRISQLLDNILSMEVEYRYTRLMDFDPPN